MAQKIQSIRGMHDILPNQTPLWQHLESTVRKLLNRYGYKEIRMPIVEVSELFSRAVGEVTDIVEKEMYTFSDRNGDLLTLRPEGTAGCVRAGIQHGLLHNQQQRLWYTGPMFRHERPQKGRYRQFQQVGVETYGIASADIDAELITMGFNLWQQLGLKNIRLELNTLGSNESRQHYREKLIAYFSEHLDVLDADAKNRLHSNPLRILDTKNPEMKDIVKNAPELYDYIDDESKSHFQGLCTRLDTLGISYTVNTRLVRGLDYYSRTVFEWITDELGAQGTICAGGRYDGLVQQLGGRSTPASGFAMGLERLVSLMEEQGSMADTKQLDIYLIMAGDRAQLTGILLAEMLRKQLPHLRILTNCGGGSFKAQIKRADKSGANLALILGDDEIEKNNVTIKFLRQKKDQETISQNALEQYLRKL